MKGKKAFAKKWRRHAFDTFVAPDEWDWSSAPVSAEDAMSEVRANLLERGVYEALAVSPWCPRGAVLLAEAANWAAKLDGDYSDKVEAFVAAAHIPGVEAGWCRDGTFALRSKCAGTVHAHDPFGEIERAGGWRFPSVDWVWSGVTRQELAFKLLVSRQLCKRIAALTGGDP